MDTTSSVDNSFITFPGNSDRDTSVEHEIDPIATRFIRLYPQTWWNHICMRWEVYGCYFGVTCPAISLANSDVSRSGVALAGWQVELRCSDGFAFGSTHESDVITANCLHTGSWDVDFATLFCSCKANYSSSRFTRRVREIL